MVDNLFILSSKVSNLGNLFLLFIFVCSFSHNYALGGKSVEVLAGARSEGKFKIIL